MYAGYTVTVQDPRASEGTQGPPIFAPRDSKIIWCGIIVVGGTDESLEILAGRREAEVDKLSTVKNTAYLYD